MNVITKYFFLLMFIWFYSCKKEKDDDKIIPTDNQLIVDLNHHKEKSPLGTSLVPFAYVDSLPEDFKGIPDYNYISFQYLLNNRTRNVEKILSEGKIDSSDVEDLLSKTYAISAIEGDQQIMILDMNQNHDFSDDQKYVYDASFRSQTSENRGVRDSFPLLNFKHKTYFKHNIRDRDRFLRLIPYKDYLFSTKPVSEMKQRYFDLQLVGVDGAYLEGSFEIDSVFFNVAIRRYEEDYDFVFIKKKRGT